MNNKKRNMRIAFLGPKGSHSHIAAIQYTKHYFINNQIIEYSCEKFIDILNLLKINHAEYGILPIENSNSGLINEVYNLLLHTQLQLIDEITIPIKHYILVNHKSSLKNIQFIYSHIQPIKQCSQFLKNFITWKIILCKSSSDAIKKVAQLNQPNSAALGSIEGGIFYGLRPLLSHNLSNQHNNSTRFIILKNKF